MEDGLEVILQDFDVKPSLCSTRNLENGIVWFYGTENDEMHHEKPIGHPKDYLEIRDDSTKLKEFLSKLLDKGRVYYGTSHWNQDGETNYAEYAIWLYTYCKNENFKKNFEQATIELLKSELKREFKPFDYQTAMKTVLERNYENHFVDQDIQTARWRYDISDIDDESEGWFRTWFDEELGKTIKKENPLLKYEITDYEKTSQGFKEALKIRYIHKEAYNIALKEFTPQFNRLVGLLDIVIELGKQDNGFSKLYGGLNEEVEVFRIPQLFKSDKTLKYSFTNVNLNRHLNDALLKIGYMDQYLEELRKIKLEGKE